MSMKSTETFWFNLRDPNTLKPFHSLQKFNKTILKIKLKLLKIYSKKDMDSLDLLAQMTLKTT